MFIQITMASAQTNELFYSANTLVHLEHNKASSNQALSTDENMNLSAEDRQKQMKSATRWLLVGTLVQIGGSFLVMTDTNFSSHSHFEYYGGIQSSNMRAHSHLGFTPIIAAGSAINLIGIWKMYRAWK